MKAARSQLASYEAEVEDICQRVGASCNDKDVVGKSKSRLATLDGSLEKLQGNIDAIVLEGDQEEERAARKQLVQRVNELAPRIAEVHKAVLHAASTAALALKDAGNTALKKGDNTAALQRYSEAIALDSKNHLFYSNRSACLQKLKQWKKAESDAREALKLNVDFVKGYMHCSRCHMQMKQYAEAATCVENAPLALQSTPEMNTLKLELATQLKAVGNADFKVRYSLACRSLASSPLPRSLFSAVRSCLAAH
jgi:tetratricopeptide (TPR) repeat protein